MKEFLYKVGDKVTVRRDVGFLPPNWREISFAMCSGPREAHATCMTSLMRLFSGKVVTISEVTEACYHIKEDPDEFFWTDEMFEETFRPAGGIGFNSLL